MSEPSPSPDFDQLLQHRGWVHRLCRQLVAQPADADEIEQETWRRALSAPPRHDANVRGWLSTVVRSVSAQKWRSDARRKAAYERFDRRESVKSDAADDLPDPLEQRETFAALNRMLLELESPFGETVFLRYVEDLSPTAIAERMRVPVATVKSRLRRGLALLRARAAQELGGDWRARLLVFTPSMTAASNAALWTTVMTLTKTKVAAGFAAVVLIATAYQLQSGEADSVDSSSLEAVAIEGQLVDLPGIPEPATLVAESVNRTRVEQSSSVVSSAESGPTVRVQVVDAITREPRPDAQLLIVDYGKERPGRESIREFQNRIGSRESETTALEFGEEIQLDAGGWGEVPSEAINFSLRVFARTETEFGEAPFTFDPDRLDGEPIRILLRRKVDIPVRVRYPSGDAAPDVTVFWSMARENAIDMSAEAIARSDQDGKTILKNVQARYAEMREHGKSTVVVARVASVDLCLAEVDMNEGSPGLVEITVPRMISMEVAIPKSLAEGLVPEWVVSLQSAEGVPTEGSFYYDGFPRRLQQASARIDQGIARFDQVQAGYQGYIALQLPNPNRPMKFIWQWVEVPVHQDSTYRVALRVPEERDGIPVQFTGLPEGKLSQPEWSFVSQALNGTRITHRDKLQFDSDGAAVYRESVEYMENSPDRRLTHMKLVADRGPGKCTVLFAQADLASITSNHGTLEIPYFNDLIVSGTVEDQGGNPLPEFSISLSGAGMWDETKSLYLTDTAWVRTSESGYFEVRGKLGSLDSLSLAPRNEVGQDVDFVEGLAGQTFVFNRPPEILGQVLLDPGVPAPDSMLVDRQGERVQGVFMIEEGAISSRYLKPGEMQVVFTDHFGVEVFRSDYFELSAGEVARPKDLQLLDLRGKFTAHRIHGYDSLGTECERLTISRPGIEEVIEVKSGQAFSATDQVFSAMIESKGHAAQSDVVVSGELRVDFEAALQLDVTLPDGIADPTGEKAWILAAWKDRDGGFGKHSCMTRAEAGSNRLHLPVGGEWQLALYALPVRFANNSDRFGSRPIGSRDISYVQVDHAVDTALPESLNFEWQLDVEAAQAHITGRD